MGIILNKLHIKELSLLLDLLLSTLLIGQVRVCNVYKNQITKYKVN